MSQRPLRVSATVVLVWLHLALKHWLAPHQPAHALDLLVDLGAAAGIPLVGIWMLRRGLANLACVKLIGILPLVVLVDHGHSSVLHHLHHLHGGGSGAACRPEDRFRSPTQSGSAASCGR